MRLHGIRLALAALTASLVLALSGGVAAVEACADHHARAVTAASAPRAMRTLVIPAGTSFPVTLVQTVSTRTHERGDRVAGRLARNVVAHGRTIFPRGARVDGVVVQSARAGNVNGRARLQVAWDRVIAYGVATRVRAYGPVVVGASSTSGDLERVGAGAGAGAILGGILGGKSGALKGAVVGGAAGTAASVLERGPDARMDAGSVVYTRLAQPVRVANPALLASARRARHVA